MKRTFLLAFLSIFILTGCSLGVGNVQTKTEYALGEEAFLDQYQITCNDYEILDNYNEKNGQFLKVNYTVTNNSDTSTTVYTASDFKLLQDDKEYSNLIQKEIEFTPYKTEKLEIIFDLSDNTITEPYKTIFYSNVATNNVAFILEKE